MIVVDTSAVLAALLARPPNARLVTRLAADGDLHAPHLVDVEFLHALRRLLRRGEVTGDRVAQVRLDFADLSITRYPHTMLADRIWALRENLTAYDAAFVVLAELLGAPLVTVDARLGRVSGGLRSRQQPSRFSDRLVGACPGRMTSRSVWARSSPVHSSGYPLFSASA